MFSIRNTLGFYTSGFVRSGDRLFTRWFYTIGQLMQALFQVPKRTSWLMLSLFPFVPAHLLCCPSTVAVSTAHLTAGYFFLKILLTAIRQNQKGDCFSLISLVVKVQNQRVCFPTIKTRMGLQIFPDVLTLLIPKPLQIVISTLRILQVGRTRQATMAKTTERLKTIWLTRMLIKFTLLLLNFAVRTFFQLREV